MAKFKVGDKVRVIRDGVAGLPIGTVSTVIRVDELGVFLSAKNKYGTTAFYTDRKVELVPSKPTKKQRLTDAERSIATLEKQVAELTAKVDALEKAEKPVGINLKEIVAKFEAQKTPNEQRKAIIAEAKAFVEAQKQDFHGKRLYQVGAYMVNAEFIINKEKRAVTALLYWHSPAMKKSGEPRQLKAKGIAKCAPDDVFNADIGKAIALGRALGLDVKRFEQAVKPTKPSIGQLITFKQSDGWHGVVVYRIDSVEKSDGNLTIVKDDTSTPKLGGKACADVSNDLHPNLVIYEDTDAKY